LAEHVRVTGASLENGLLNVFLEREVPEALKSLKISINGKSASLIDSANGEAKSEASLDTVLSLNKLLKQNPGVIRRFIYDRI
jgi:hypothetical protein